MILHNLPAPVQMFCDSLIGKEPMHEIKPVKGVVQSVQWWVINSLREPVRVDDSLVAQQIWEHIDSITERHW